MYSGTCLSLSRSQLAGDVVEDAVVGLMLGGGQADWEVWGSGPLSWVKELLCVCLCAVVDRGHPRKYMHGKRTCLSEQIAIHLQTYRYTLYGSER